MRGGMPHAAIVPPLRAPWRRVPSERGAGVPGGHIPAPAPRLTVLMETPEVSTPGTMLSARHRAAYPGGMGAAPTTARVTMAAATRPLPAPPPARPWRRVDMLPMAAPSRAAGPTAAG